MDALDDLGAARRHQVLSTLGLGRSGTVARYTLTCTLGDALSLDALAPRPSHGARLVPPSAETVGEPISGTRDTVSATVGPRRAVEAVIDCIRDVSDRPASQEELSDDVANVSRRDVPQDRQAITQLVRRSQTVTLGLGDLVRRPRQRADRTDLAIGSTLFLRAPRYVTFI
ncbi:hypothetical protein [Sanguibacter hominis]|uniref:hypothetical protein n=1 Tax=Sanguibacter hominis TaxID=1312739 RepID=UPI00256FAA8D|nr:hypothetical protein [Sanguibacter hominis]